MTEFISAASRVGFGRESTFGTQVATTRFLGITNQAITPPDKDLDVKQYRSFGAGRRWFLNKAGRRERTGTLPFVPTTGELFYYAFGQDSFTAGSPNTHVLSPVNTATLPSMSLGVALEGSPNFLRTFVGTVVDGMSLSLNEDAELTCSMDIRSKAVEDEEEATPTLFTQPSGADHTPYMFYDRAANVTLMGSYDYTANTITGGRTIARVKTFSCGIRNNLKPQWFSQSSNAQDVFTFLNSYPDFDLSLEIVPAGKLSSDTDALYDILESETRADILIPFQRTANDRLDFVFDNCMLKTAPHELPDDGGEVKVAVSAMPEEFRVVVRDSISQYSTV